MKQEKGFILPSMMIIVFFCLLIVAHLSTALISEKKFYAETTQYYVLDHLMKIGVQTSLKDIQNGTINLSDETKINTENGDILFTTKEISPMIFEVSLTCETTEHKKYTASYQYDLTKKEMILWSEY